MSEKPYSIILKDDNLNDQNIFKNVINGSKLKSKLKI